MTTALERRLAAIEAAIPPPQQSDYDKFVAKYPMIEWMTCDELLELEQLYRECDDDADRMPPADQARAMSIWYAAEARMLAGEPKDTDLPPQPYDIAESYRKSEREYQAKLAREAKGR